MLRLIEEAQCKSYCSRTLQMSNYRERFFIHIEYFLHIAFVITTAREADSKKCVR